MSTAEFISDVIRSFFGTGTFVGQVFAWTGSAWLGNDKLALGDPTTLDATLDLNGNPLKNARSYRSAQVAVAAGTGTVTLMSRTMGTEGIVSDTGRTTVELRIVVEDSDGSNPFTDDIKVDLKAQKDTSGSLYKAYIADHETPANNDGPFTTAEIDITGPQSGYTYTVQADANPLNDLFKVLIAKDGSTARVAQITAWWDDDTTGWNTGSW